MPKFCQGKVCMSKHHAENVIKGRKLSKITKKKSRMYLCDVCYYYHISTTNEMLK